MQITELCKKCCVTKKAVEYYCKKGLLQPEILENGYRVFSDEDERTLNKIHTLRKLGFSVCEIDTILKENEKAALQTFMADSGYNDIFIPAMCSLSETYRAYRQKLLEANAKFLQMYPQPESDKK